MSNVDRSEKGRLDITGGAIKPEHWRQVRSVAQRLIGAAGGSDPCDPSVIHRVLRVLWQERYSLALLEPTSSSTTLDEVPTNTVPLTPTTTELSASIL